MPARISRYPFRRKLEREWADVPLDAADRSSPTLRAELRDLPSERLSTLRFKLRSANSAYGEVRRQYQKALAAARRDPWGDAPEEIRKQVAAAVAELATNKAFAGEVGEALRGALATYLERFALPAAEPSPAAAVAELRTNPAFAGAFGRDLLRFAEALEVADRAVAAAAVNERFAEPVEQATAGVVRVRREIVACGVVGHSEFEAELYDEKTGVAILDPETGAPQVLPIPFVGAKWSHNGRKLEGCSEETLAVYSEACSGEGLILSLSEAVLLFNRGVAVTPAAVWDSYLGAPPKRQDDRQGEQKEGGTQEAGGGANGEAAGAGGAEKQGAEGEPGDPLP
jgi:hypothetical protein